MSEKHTLPENLSYTKEHEWVRVDGDAAVVGLTDHAQEALGEVTYVEMPPVGKVVEQFGELAVIESAKAASEMYAPLTGTVSEVNDRLEEAPETINQSPYDEGWICKLTGIDPAQVESLLSPEQYAELLENPE